MNTVCLSEETNRILKDYLKSRGCGIIEIGRTDAVYSAIASHADIYLCKIRDELIVAPEQYPLIGKALLQCGAKVSCGASPLGSRYPANVKYNAAQLGEYLIHNFSHTDPLILEKAKEAELQTIRVKQGYTKCNLVVVDEKSAITSDVGLASVLGRYGIDILLISQGHVALPGFPYGFLGGATGRVGKEIIFNGNLSAHLDFEDITSFISERKLQAVWFEDYPLQDIGSIIQLTR